MNGRERSKPQRNPELQIPTVTTLASRGHRERGTEARANACMVKSSFDQSNWLEIIGRLL
jgi:two-component system, chemotaxis family, sensor kinase CheA